ncbi:Electron transfer flavoprotein subunit beta [Vibrio nigripulchritudo SFn27]|uniref:Electron transfer flavoprotein subunit beta n=1 Tax=Vibrio nigripulchritudo TaxID=28173 RepID=U4K3G4_9VIBR|nr:electron transfer flavoprotein subunit beta/FixA family protein [Vibrio nigripulchritudo]CCN83821.1 Electron transfer flavoprotein subunit beta [Vibrio nigripulchritudo BLFn1]CCN87171.1 Electron transfer flavoprotein subunit beta [Vibrio nigripulchritudo SFn27]CCN94527.1 Electron transfer flavoprotein subunit beta [Vibrio nigripulchritudo ENn2]CCO40907.1 Electron transfer flavoprotein subunit beta [Vibrio nigripulchritudo SFn135]CCO54986.1 Electron transfer flavoprotein subunit beta [Vibrio
MKIIVGIKRVLDHNVRVRIQSDQSDVDLTNSKMTINPFCEIAVEEAVRLKESQMAKEVVVVSIGPSACHEQLRSALSIGADRAIHVATSNYPHPLSVAKILARISENENADLILLGKQSIDTDNNQVGQMLAGLLGIGQATFASKLFFDGKPNTDSNNGPLFVTREVDGGLQTVALKLPALVTTDLRLNTPRYVRLPDIVKAKRKPLEIHTPESLGIKVREHSLLIKVEPPEIRAGGVRVSNVDELIYKLKSEAKVI